MKVYRGLVLILLFLLIIGCSGEKEFPAILTDPCENSEDRFDCVVMKGLEENNPRYCELISDETCYQILAMRSKDYPSCDKVSDDAQARHCKVMVSIDSRDYGDCMKYAFKDSQENWNAGMITKSMCQVQIEGTVVGKGKIAISTPSLELCEQQLKNVGNEETKKLLLESCYLGEAIKTGDVAVCHSIESVTKYFCMARVLSRSETELKPAGKVLG